MHYFVKEYFDSGLLQYCLALTNVVFLLHAHLGSHCHSRREWEKGTTARDMST